MQRTIMIEGALERGWLDQRHYQDLDPRAERALRAAGLNWQDEDEAERELAQAAALAPNHLAVAIAHYRYHLYKHHFFQALPYARRCLAHAARVLGLPEDHRSVTSAHADFRQQEPRLRFWMFALQAYGYVLLRCGERDAGVACLTRLAQLDRDDQTKTRVLLEVITRPESDDEA